MKKYILIIFLLIPLGMYAQTWSWVKSEGSPDAEYGSDITADINENVYVTGPFVDTIVFGPDTLISRGGVDVFLAKYDSSGNLLWIVNAGGTGLDLIYSVVMDNSGYVYITGFFTGSATFIDTVITGKGNTDIFIAKLSSEGNLVWVKTAGGKAGDSSYSIKTDNLGNFYITGSIGDTAVFESMTVNVVRSTFLAKYDSTGNIQWVRTGIGTGGGLDIGTDANNNIYVIGNFGGNLLFDTTTLVGNYNDFFIVKYDGSGTLQWAISVGDDADTEQGVSIATLPIGDFYITGSFTGTATFDTATIASKGSDDIYIAKYNTNGKIIWLKQAGGLSSDEGRTIVISPSGDLWIAGNFSESAAFDATTVTSAGSEDIFLAGYSTSGSLFSLTVGGGSGSENAFSIAATLANKVYLTGYFFNTMTLGDFSVVSAGSADILLAKLSLPSIPSSIVSSHPSLDVLVFPCPVMAGDKITITSKVKGEITVYNQFGQKLMETSMKNNVGYISTASLSHGIYFYNIIENNQVKDTGKFIIQ